MTPLSTRSYPRAILHFDGDAFFASVEQALDHTLKGKPVVTGAERGAATSISYEAKARGVHRGMTMRDIKKACPEAIIVPGNYTAYSIYARRMYAIARSFTPMVEEYSIDECFADITGLRQRFRMSYEDIALMMKARLEEELGITFGVGLAPTKTLAKVASKYRKPSGFTAIPGKKIHEYLAQVRVGQVWGLGGVSSLYLEKLGVHTALQFAEMPESWLEEHKFAKPYREIWAELNGRMAKSLNTKQNDTIGSIMKTHTFRATRDRAQIISELSKNVEAACAKARRYGVRAKALSFYLKTQEFQYYGRQMDLPISLNDPSEILRAIMMQFDEVYEPSIEYRATGVTLRALVVERAMTYDLFGAMKREEEHSQGKLRAVDAINRRYGRYTIVLASSLPAVAVRENSLEGRRGRRVAMDIDDRKKTLDIPYLGKVH